MAYQTIVSIYWLLPANFELNYSLPLSFVKSNLNLNANDLRHVERVILTACGTSYHACLAGRYWVEQYARLPAQAELASEVRYRQPVFSSTDLVVAVSQSGETADTLAAVRAAREQGARILAVANVLESAIPRSADGALYTHAGPEIGVASTKAFTTQLAVLLLLAAYLGRRRGALDADQARALQSALVSVPALMRPVGKAGMSGGKPFRPAVNTASEPGYPPVGLSTSMKPTASTPCSTTPSGAMA